MSTPFFTTDHVTVHHGDCLDVMRALPDASVDAIVTDPPYGLGFMGKAWDSLPPGLPWATECLRVLRPGGHLLAFGGTRTWHRLAVAVEDAGFEMRDSIAWLYGSGFPKSLDVSKAIEQRERGALVRSKLLHFATERGVNGQWLEAQGVASAASFADWTTGGHVPSEKNWAIVKGALDVTPDEEAAFEREVLAEGKSRLDDGTVYGLGHSGRRLGSAVTPDAQQWQGWGTALKPAFEPIVVGRKPLAGTVAANVLAFGTGALNIDGCRVETDTDTRRNAAGGDNGLNGSGTFRIRERRAEDQPERSGRWPANVVLDESQADELDRQTGVLTSGANPTRRGSDKFRDAYGDFNGQEECTPARGADSGGPSRFFPTFRYQAKAPASERPRVDGVAHPTVKPLALMQWLVRLVTPPGGVVLEPFAGSGTTLEACILEGVDCIGIELGAEHLPLIMQRITRSLDKGFPGEGWDLL